VINSKVGVMVGRAECPTCLCPATVMDRTDKQCYLDNCTSKKHRVTKCYCCNYEDIAHTEWRNNGEKS
jgi:hypothetical protein